MGPAPNNSDVRRLLNQIEAEYTAAQYGLTGFAESARHQAITARMENIGKLHQQLQRIVGEDAMRFIVEHLDAPFSQRQNEKG
ncbi:MAG TPA: hypothetical protein VFV38_23685 [Ktedonobacteraceae bacterium]|nr:hypothetical protein [Ktedonobacteraceae bacterium]